MPLGTGKAHVRLRRRSHDPQPRDSGAPDRHPGGDCDGVGEGVNVKPYYEEPGIVIYHGDCREILPLLPDKSADLVLTDPPYGIGRSGKPTSTSSHGGHKGFEDKGWDNQAPGKEYFAELFRVSKHQIIWGANYYPQHLPPSSGWILWDKGQRIDQADGELAFSSIEKPRRADSKTCRPFIVQPQRQALGIRC